MSHNDDPARPPDHDARASSINCEDDAPGDGQEAFSEHSKAKPARFAHTAEIAYLALIALTLVLVRMQAVSDVPLNVDECQYMATAAFLNLSGESSFSGDVYPVLITSVYRAFTVFQPYPLIEVRVFVGILAALMTLCIWWWVRRLGAFPAFFACMAFVLLPMYWEGHSANREWFANLGIVAGSCLVLLSLATKTTSRTLLFCAIAGLLAALAQLFKLQALPLAFMMPLALVLESIRIRRPQLAFGRILAWLAGYITMYLAISALYSIHGVGSYLLPKSGGSHAAYAAGSHSLSEILSQLVPGMFWQQPFRSAILLATFVAMLIFVLYCVALFRTFSGKEEKAELDVKAFAWRYAALWLFTAFFCVSIGGRFFPHYSQFLLPPVAILLGVCVASVLNPRSLENCLPTVTGRWLAAAMLAVVIAEFIARHIYPMQLFPSYFQDDFPAIGFAIIFGIAGAVTLFALRRPSTESKLAPVAATLWVAMLGFHMLESNFRRQVHPLAVSREETRPLAEFIAGNAKSSIYVWGWRPEIYYYANVPPSSRFAITQYVVNDMSATSEPKLQPQKFAKLMDDFARHPPSFLVFPNDWGIALSKSSPYAAKRFPELVDYMETNGFHLVARFPQSRGVVDVYARGDVEPQIPTPGWTTSGG